MKNSIKYAFLLVAAFFMAACQDSLKELNKGEEELALSLGCDSVLVLNEVAASETGLALTWTTGSNRQTGNRIFYRLEVADQAAGYDEGIVAVNGATQTYSWSKSVEETNNLAFSFGYTAGQTANLMARVSAYGEGFEEQVSEIFFQVTTYEPVTSTLYLVGSAAPCGWSKDDAVEMTRLTNGQFKWEGNMSIGSYKFLCTTADWVPSYNKGTDGLPVLRATEADPDEQWNIDEAGFYTIIVNILSPSISVTKGDGAKPRFDELFIMGDETGWSFQPLQKDILDPYLFRLGRIFSVGKEFKFGTASGDWQNNYKATSPNAPYTQTTMEFVTGYDPDNKWFLTEEELGAYKICVDIREGQERMMMVPFVPFPTVALIGSATAAGWGIGNAIDMTADPDDPFVFTWTGALTAGELKFTCDKQSDWMGAWFLASEVDKAPTGEPERLLFVNKSDSDFKAQYLETNINDVDMKWKITDAATYTITLNQLEETVTIAKN